jgi:hypothetical protein
MGLFGGGVRENSAINNDELTGIGWKLSRGLVKDDPCDKA